MKTTLSSFLLLALVACGEPPSLLEAGNLEDEVYGGASDGGGYGVSSTDPADVGTVRGFVKFEGRPYKRKSIQLGKDKFCVNANPNGLRSEEFLFDPATGALENVMVYVQRGMNMKFDPPSEPIVLNQIGCRYTPHMGVLQVGQPLVVKSQDNTLHNVHGWVGTPEEFNKTINTPGALSSMVFDSAQNSAPILIKCDVHGWMKSYFAVLKHPFCSITGKDGKFELKGVPPGKYRLLIWHEYFQDEPQIREITLTRNQTLDLGSIVFKR